MLKHTRKITFLLLAFFSCLALSRLVIGLSPQVTGRRAKPSPNVQATTTKSARAQKASRPAATKPADLRVRQGALRVLDKQDRPSGPSREGVKAECPLKHTDVQVKISGFIARVRVTQEFHNPFEDKIEAVYVFPLSQDAAVDDMTLVIGERRIRGQIKPREEARRIYEAAKAAGHRASLLDQERPNIFTQSVANIMPGEDINVQISYVEFLPYEDGLYRFVFPMVVGPRYIPSSTAIGKEGTGWAPDTDRVPDASKITPPVTRPETRAGHDIAISVSLDAGVPVGDIRSQLHDIDVERKSASFATIRLKSEKTIPNKDFILTYETAGNEIAEALLTHATKERDGFFSLILQPPKRVPARKIAAKEMIFVIDTSGSQMGWPIEKAKETMEYCIKNMNRDDTFQLLGFSNDVVPLFDGPQLNTPENREKAFHFLSTRLGMGGTELLKAVLAALTTPPTSERLRIVCFMTDGYVGNDLEILDAIQKHIGQSRLFSFGVGNSVNRFLLDKMAEIGRGSVEYVTLNQSGEEVARRFHERIANPVLTDIQIDWRGMPVTDVYPQRIPDLFSSKPLILRGRYNGAINGVISLKGKVAGKPFERGLPVDLPESNPNHDVLASLWARACIDDLMSQDYYAIQRGAPQPNIKEAITKLGLEFNLMTQYTSFVAVEEMTVTEGGKPRTIAVPVEMPEGVSYEGVFGQGGGAKMEVQSAYTMSASVAPGSSGGIGGGMGAGVGPRVAGGVVGGYIGRGRSTGFGAGAGVLVEREKKSDADVRVPQPSPALAKPPLELSQKRKDSQVIAQRKMDHSLIGLAEKFAREGKSGHLKLNKIEVKDGKVEVAVWLTEAASKCLEKLKAVGFEPITKAKSVRMVLGKISVDKLEALANLDCVARIEPPIYLR